MKKFGVLSIAILLLSSVAQLSFADSLDLNIAVPKAIYGPSEPVELYGGLYNISASNGTYSGISGAQIVIYIINSSGSLVNSTVLNTSAGGSFHSRNSYDPNGTLILAPNPIGNYTINATYDSGTIVYSSSAVMGVVSKSVDDIRIRTDSSDYYPSAAMILTIEAATVSGDNRLPVANISINGTIRNLDDAVYTSFNCITGSSGTCTISDNVAPSEAGNYIIEANNYIGYATFKVVPFDVDVYIKDDTGKTVKNTFYPGQSGQIEVRASYNGSNPTGDFTVSGNIYDSDGAVASSITSFILNSNNSYMNKAQFTVGSEAVGTYTARVIVAKTGDGSVNGSALYQVKQWELSVSKTSTNNGFESGYTAFGNATVYFKADVVDLSNGAGIAGLENNFTVRLKNHFGDDVSNITAGYNSSLDDYLFNVTLPSVAGQYNLLVSALHSGQTQAITKTITVTNMAATVTPANAEGTKKEVFTLSEFVYLKITAKNSTANANISQAELISVSYEGGNSIAYNSTEDCNAMNLTDNNFEWCWNSNTSTIKLDPPKKGGLFVADVYANNNTLSASGTFAIKPYGVCVSAKASENVGDSVTDYYWQFKTTDSVYFLVTLTYAQDTTGMTTGSSDSGNSSGSSAGSGSVSGGMGMGSSYGMGSRCTVGNTSSAVENATITISKVVNVQSGKEESLNTTTSVCKSTTSGGKAVYVCTLASSDSRWDGGRYYAVLDITGPDGETKDNGYGMFEARSFYLYGWSNSWQNKPGSDINFTISMYSGGSGGWFSGGSSGGLSGTVSLEKIIYLGTGWGNWITPIDYEYNTQGMVSSTITNGMGTLALNASRAPDGRWKSGMYTAVIKGTDSGSGDVDYGEIWFEVRNWYSWAQLVDVSANPYQYKWQANTKENVSLYVKISNAGDNWNSYDQSLGGNVTISVKKIEYSVTWPPKELPSANYTATSITVNASNCDLWSLSYSCFGMDSSKYIINISPTSGRWQSGYYNVVLDINGTETGWGWFSALAFYINTQTVDVNGTSAYTSKGNGPLYVNVTATKSQKYYYSYYSSADYINTTFEDLTLHRWDSSGGSWRQVDLNYPEDINVSIVGASGINLSGASMLNLTLSNSASWPSGYYYGEIVLSNNESESVTGNVWFSIEPFRIDVQSSQYEIMQNEEVNATLNVYEPGWTWPYTSLPGNYTIVSVVSRTWTYGGEQVLSLNITPASFSGSAANLTIQPPSGNWSSGWKSLTVTVRDNGSNVTKEGWLSFRVIPYKISVQRASWESYTTGLMDNVTVLVNLTHPRTGAVQSGNLSEVYKWGWPSKNYYTFVVGNCVSTSSSRPCTINGAQNVTIIPPSSGWDEGYNYLQFTFTTTGDSTPLDDWSSISFNAQQAISGYMYAVDDNGNYLWAASNTSNITMYLYSLQDINWNPTTVNVTSVKYYRSPGYWVDENSKTYTELSSSKWSVINITTHNPTGFNEINNNGYVRIAPPSGNAWENGEYYIKIYVNSAGTGSGIIKNGWFRIKDMTPVSLVINSPPNSTNSTINASFILFNATTSKSATCSVSISSNGGTYYYAYLSQYGGYGYGSNSSSSVTTGGTTHLFNHSTSGMPDQSYTAWFYCNDYDYNYVNSLVVFTLNISGGGSGNSSNQTSSTNQSSSTNATIIPLVTSVVLSPSNATVNSTLRCNATVINSTGVFAKVDYRWYRNETIFAASNTTILNGTSSEVSTMASANLSLGDVWKCSVRATNNYVNYSAWLNSSSVTINSSTAVQSAPWFTYTTPYNSTLVGNDTLFSTYWHDSINLSGYIFSFDNGLGQFTNDSWIPFFGQNSWSNVTKTLNSTTNTSIRWGVYANNSNNAWNFTGIMQFITT